MVRWHHHHITQRITSATPSTRRLDLDDLNCGLSPCPEPNSAVTVQHEGRRNLSVSGPVSGGTTFPSKETRLSQRRHFSLSESPSGSDIVKIRYNDREDGMYGM